MEIVVNANTIIGVAGLISAVGVIIGLVINTYKQIEKWNAYDTQIKDVGKEISALKTEQYLQIQTERAIIDGLHQLGCNGRTTEAAEKLDDYLARKSHDVETKV